MNNQENDHRIVIGQVASPPQLESTPERFHFWVQRGCLVEQTQIVCTESVVGGQHIRFYGIINDIRRRSRKANIEESFDEMDGEVDNEPLFQNEGVTYASVSILRAEPPVLTPPLEHNLVWVGGIGDARIAYSADEIERPLAIGLVKNGGNMTAGPGSIDLDYLLGVNGGHLNVNGSAGRGTKSSFLMFVVHQLLARAHEEASTMPSDPRRLQIVPIILNVKGFDLFFIDKPNRHYKPRQHASAWKEIGVPDPQTFRATFYAPQMPNQEIPISTGRTDVNPYSWSLSDITENGLLMYLFADEDVNDLNFSALLLDLEAHLTNETGAQRVLRKDAPRTFEELLEWLNNAELPEKISGHHPGTWQKLRRRFRKILFEAGGVLRLKDLKGHPLHVIAGETQDPKVVDLNGLARMPGLQRFVVAAIFKQLIEHQTGERAQPNLIYLIVLDELNRFAPKNSRDPITQLIETAAAEMRSQGIILLSAQQQASKVSERVIENTAIVVLGRTGNLELSQPIWKSIGDAARRKAASLPAEEKLVIQDDFREPMHVRIPFPVWAMNRREVSDDQSVVDGDGEEILTY